MARTRPPTTIVGSRPAAWRIEPVIEVVVVFPCDPAIAIPVFTRITSASISARLMTGIPAARAAASSGLSSPTADE